jgi:HEAT repeat protein
VVTSDAELTYRLQAIRYLATQGDRQAVSALQQIVHAPGEQPSIRDAAARALTTIGGS